MAGGSKRSKRARLNNDSESEDISDEENVKVKSVSEDYELSDEIEDDEVDSEEDNEGDSEDDDEGDSEEDDDEGDNKEDEDGESEEFEDGNDKESESGDEGSDDNKDAEMEELEKEYKELRSQEQDILRNLKRDKGEDAVKGQAVKNQKALWDKTLEFRFLLQKAFNSSNRLPQEPVRSSYCSEDENVSAAYTDLVASSKKTLDSLLELQEALLEKNPSVDLQQVNRTASAESSKSDAEDSDEWQQIADLQKRMSVFRNKAVDKWQRRTQVTSGAAAIKGKLHAFNQNVSEQVASYMRDPSRMIKQMQQSRSTVAVFGTVPGESMEPNQEERQLEGDPELIEDAEFYQQLLKEFIETIDPASSEAAYYAMKKFQTKKRKVVDRRASKSRKIRYNVHEKIVNFMAPRPAKIPPNTADLLKNLFGLKTRNGLSEA
ncbi:PREDICTED: putative uncharacterized protein DDB_G0270496 isoform X1 [Camelina sativa]|uniref:Protein AATF n=1 Tax=Camelina sativa TaxID=90675 RepID=A0ABM0VJK7_CAMSA|nr:PREDICTED: putative uncharacterized protein DDB_G0270496 isoform X1 [Camelina sativa]XP_010457209.1 PREDICTED: putative uncharacterized protein DDB_G0270496 isoform X1 [Camelina sativa]